MASRAVQPGELGWIEVFHSLPSWEHCFIVFKKDEEPWSRNTKYELVSAEHLRSGFRVFRIRARKLEYFLTNGSKRGWDDNYGRYYHVGMPGRYVCGQGAFDRVGDADGAECERFVRGDTITLRHTPPASWRQVYALYKRDSKPWIERPGEEMQRGGDGTFTLTLKARTLQVVFNDGGERWDSNKMLNYYICVPGVYRVGGHAVEFLGESTPSDEGPPAYSSSNDAEPSVVRSDATTNAPYRDIGRPVYT